MRLRIDTSGVKFRVGGVAQPRTESRKNRAQRTLPDGRPVWVVKLIAVDSGAGEFGSTEEIWVEVAGSRPEVVLDEFAVVENLTYAPYIGGKGTPEMKIVRAFRAESVSMAAGTHRAAS